MSKQPNKISLDFIDEIKNKEKRIISFLWEDIIINPKVFPVDSNCSYSSKITAKNIENNVWYVLDIWTWTWVQAIIAAKKWAKKILAIDIDKNALNNTKENVLYHKLDNIIEIRKSDLFKNIKSKEKFDLIIAQLPFADSDYKSDVWHFLFDKDFVLHERFLSWAKKYLNHNGKIFIPSWSIANEKTLLQLISKYDYKIQEIITENFMDIERKLYIIK